MKVAVFCGHGQPVAIEEHADEPLGADDVRIAVKRCGVCGSDIAMTSGSAFDYPARSVLGHEYAGEVIEKGSAVTSLRLGQKISVLPNAYCGECGNCRAGRPLFCTRATSLFGGFGERKVVPARSAIALPSDMSFADGALVEPMACGRKAMRVAGLERGDKLLVIGAGSMALSLIYWARLGGAGRIVVLSRSARRDAIVRAFGADCVLRIGDSEAMDEERARHGEADIVAECAGSAGLLALAIDHVRLGGKVLSMGMCSAPDTVIPAMASFREASLHFPLGYSVEDLIETVRAFDTGAVRPEAMVSDTVALDDLPSVMDAMRRPHDHLKVLVDPQLQSRN